MIVIYLFSLLLVQIGTFSAKEVSCMHADDDDKRESNPNGNYHSNRCALLIIIIMHWIEFNTLGVFFPNVTHRKIFPFAKIITNNNNNNNYYAISVLYPRSLGYRSAY